MKTHYKHGSWNAICDVCGFTFKAEDMRKRWDGFMVCNKDFEFRNPQDFIKPPREEIAPPWVRPDEDYSGFLVCNYSNSRAIAGIGVAGCAVAGRATFTG